MCEHFYFSQMITYVVYIVVLQHPAQWLRLRRSFMRMSIAPAPVPAIPNPPYLSRGQVHANEYRVRTSAGQS